MHTKQKSRRVLVLVAMAWLIAAGAGPAAYAKDDELPPTDSTKPWGPGCSPDYQNWCNNNLKNYAGQPCQDVKIYVRADGKCQCDCMDKAGGINPGKKR